MYLFSCSTQQVVRMRKEAETWTDENLPIFLKNWDGDAFLSRCDEKLKKNYAGGVVHETFSKFKRHFGTFVSYGSCKSNNPGGVSEDGKAVVTIPVTASADFSLKSAKINLKLVKRDKEWKIGDFQIDDN